MKKLWMVVFAFVISISNASGADQVSVGETVILNQLYHDALAEGGALTVYAGGDTANAWDGVVTRFQQRFPGVKIAIITDLSKFHDARIDNQIARDRLSVDVAHLQTLQDFPRWKREGVLLRYVPPIGWRNIPVDLKDPEGYYTGIGIFSLGYVVNPTLVPAGEVPRTARDLLQPRFKGKIVLTYPNDDDAALFIFHQIVQQYGWAYLDDLIAQRPYFRRGSVGAGQDVASGKYAVSLDAWWPLKAPAGSTARYVTPQDTFMTWPQTAAIFKNTRHPATAKLYVNWLLSREFQSSDLTTQWPIRNDVAPAAGYQPIWTYRNTDPAAFARFMSDRAEVERFRAQLTLYVGEVQGPNPTGVGGLLPSASGSR